MRSARKWRRPSGARVTPAPLKQASQISEEGGYRMHSLIQIAPKSAAVVALGGPITSAADAAPQDSVWHTLDPQQITETGGAV